MAKSLCFDFFGWCIDPCWEFSYSIIPLQNKASSTEQLPHTWWGFRVLSKDTLTGKSSGHWWLWFRPHFSNWISPFCLSSFACLLLLTLCKNISNIHSQSQSNVSNNMCCISILNSMATLQPPSLSAHPNRAQFFHYSMLFQTVSISVLSTLYSKSETECLLYAAQRVTWRTEKVDIFDQRASLSVRVALLSQCQLPVTGWSYNNAPSAN